MKTIGYLALGTLSLGILLGPDRPWVTYISICAAPTEQIRWQNVMRHLDEDSLRAFYLLGHDGQKRVIDDLLDRLGCPVGG